MSRLVLGVWLLVVWILLWGELSVANVLSGLVVLTVLYLVFPTTRPVLPRRRLRPLALLHLIGYFLVELVLANWSVTRSLFSRRSSVHSGFVDVPLHTEEPGLITLITTMTALTPGSVMVRVQQSPPIVRVHAFGCTEPASVAGTIGRLEQLCAAVFGEPVEPDTRVTR